MGNLLSSDNRLLSLARRRRRPTPVLLAFLLASLVTASFAIGGALLVGMLPIVGGASTQRGPLVSGAALVAELLLGFGPVLLFLWLWLRFFEGRRFRTLGLRKRGALKDALRGVLVGLLVMAAVVGVLAALGYAGFESGEPRLGGFAALGGVLLVALGWAVQGSAEEIVCRGWLLQTAAIRFGTLPGVILSSLVFASFHAFNPDITLLALVNLVLLGVFLAFYALREGGLWGVCALHATLNWAEGNLFGFDLYGEEAPGGVLLNLRESGPDLVTGGGVGTNTTGGLAATAVLACGVAAVVLVARQRAKTAAMAPADGRSSDVS